MMASMLRIAGCSLVLLVLCGTTPAGTLASRLSALELQLTLADPGTFTEVPDDHQGEAVLAVAAKVGATRLIDNVTVTLH